MLKLPTLLVLLSGLAGVLLFARTNSDGAAHHLAFTLSDEGERMIDERFSVRAGGTLEVRVADADVQVETTAANEARVEVYLDGRNMDRAREYFRHLNFQVEQRGDAIVVSTNPPRNFRFDSHGGASIHVRATIPSRFNADVQTSDGDVVLGELQGRVTIQTSDGDIATQSLEGPHISLRTSDGDIAAGEIRSEEAAIQTSDGDIALQAVVAAKISVRTSDGDIALMRLEGESDVMTSDGDIYVRAFRGPVLRARSSDGSIVAEDLVGEHVELRTSDGSISAKRVDSHLQARTSSGDIAVEVLKSGNVELQTSDGDIVIAAPAGLAADLHLKGGRVQVSSALAFEGRLEEDEAQGTLNGGGHTLTARTSDGTVVLKAH